MLNGKKKGLQIENKDSTAGKTDIYTYNVIHIHAEIYSQHRQEYAIDIPLPHPATQIHTQKKINRLFGFREDSTREYKG